MISTPLGNLGDLSKRAERVLRSARLAASEDTRRTVKLLNSLGVSLPQMSYREQNHASAWPRVRDALARGHAVAVLTDAGAPAVSDPGAALAAAAREAGYPVYPIPGPSAVTAALSAAGFPAGSFTFCGFPPARRAARRRFLEAYRRLRHPLVFFEAPHRLAESLADLAEVLGPRRALLAREMTKIHEEYLAGRLDRLLEDVTARPRRGEITLVVEGAPRDGGPEAGPGWPRNRADAAGSGYAGGPGGEDCPEGEGGPADPSGGGLAGRPGAAPAGLPGGPDGKEAGGALGSPDAVAALAALREAALADTRPLAESARELSSLTGVPRKALYALLSAFRSPGG
jgi:16S rRNA (cytidine1402-2'-O)-methyltransferase